MKTKTNKSSFVGIRLDDALAARVQSLADELGLSTSCLIRMMFAYLDDRKIPVGRLKQFKAWLKRMRQMAII